MSINRGALIVLEGVDRSGKSTQARLLVENLKKHFPTELVVFPDRSTLTGKLISEYLSNSELKLDDKAIHLLFASNRWENVCRMKQLLNSGVTLIVDRYSYSGIAYSGSKKGMDVEWCKTQEEGLPKPDIVFLLKLSEEDMVTRPGFGGERYEDNSIQKKVLEIYNSLLDSSWEIVDANDTIENINKVLINKILKKVELVKDKKLEKLNFGKNHTENIFNSINSDIIL